MTPHPLAARLLAARVELHRATEEARLARERHIDKGGDVLRRRWLEALARQALAQERIDRLDLLITDSDTLAESLARGS